jgi:hypothetical protein
VYIACVSPWICEKPSAHPWMMRDSTTFMFAIGHFGKEKGQGG